MHHNQNPYTWKVLRESLSTFFPERENQWLEVLVNKKDISPVILLLPEFISKGVERIFEWRILNKKDTIIDCKRFVELIYEITQIDSTESYSYSLIEEETELNIGDIIYLNNFPESKEDDIPATWWSHHYAIYIWDGLYVSKLWPYGTVAIGTREYMNKSYPNKYIWRIKRK